MSQRMEINGGIGRIKVYDKLWNERFLISSEFPNWIPIDRIMKFIQENHE